MEVGSPHGLEAVVVVYHFVEAAEVQRVPIEVRLQSLECFSDATGVHYSGDDVAVEVCLFPLQLVGTQVVLLFYHKITFVERVGYPGVALSALLHMNRHSPLPQPKLVPVLIRFIPQRGLEGRLYLYPWTELHLFALELGEQTHEQVLETLDGAIGVGTFGVDERIVEFGGSGVGEEGTPVFFVEYAAQSKVHVTPFLGELASSIFGLTDVGVIMGVGKGRVADSMASDALNEDEPFGGQGYKGQSDKYECY